MSDADPLSAIRARLAKATPGPWQALQNVRETHPEHERVIVLHGVHSSFKLGAMGVFHGPDVERSWAFDDLPFIAHARDDIPTLLALYDAALARIAALEAALTDSRRAHAHCDDSWYCCGACRHPDHGLADGETLGGHDGESARQSGVCNCGAEAWDAKVDALTE